MTSYRIIIQPISPGTHGGHGGLSKGSGVYATTPQGERSTVLPATQAQIVGLQGYIVQIKGGVDTSSIETAITATTPT